MVAVVVANLFSDSMGTFSIIASSTSAVVHALRAYLEEREASDFAFCPVDAEKPHKWEVTGLVLVDYIPLRVQICVEARVDSVKVSVNQLSRNDIVKFNLMCRRMMTFLQECGLQVASYVSATSFQTQLLDDDFDFSDDEGPSWDEKIESVLHDTNSIRTEVREEAFRAIAQWAVSTPAPREALAEGFIDRADELFALFCTSSRASVAETYPFAAAMRTLSEGCSFKTRRKLLESRLSTILDAASNAIFPAVVAKEYKIAMQALGKVEISTQIGQHVTKTCPTCKFLREELGEEANGVDVATVRKDDEGCLPWMETPSHCCVT